MKVKPRLWLVLLLGICLSIVGSIYITHYFHSFDHRPVAIKEKAVANRNPTKTVKAGNNNLHNKLSAAIPILMYHSIRLSPNRLCVSPADLDRQLDYLQNHGYTTITLNQLLRALYDRGNALPAKSVVITFDDGYLDNYTEAFPRLKARHMVATIFMITRMLNVPGRLTTGELQEMHDYGIEIGSHTQHHLDLRSLKQVGLNEEIDQSRSILENIFHCPIVSFCYPSGEYTPAVVAEVRQAGYLGAVTVKPGKVSCSDNPFLLPRVRVNGGESMLTFIAGLGSMYLKPYSAGYISKNDELREK